MITCFPFSKDKVINDYSSPPPRMAVTVKCEMYNRSPVLCEVLSRSGKRSRAYGESIVFLLISFFFFVSYLAAASRHDISARTRGWI